ncbi:MAG: carboxypeptidase-like regulatory domain-containing protein [Bacteroidales bacterium]|nr:carboxypeptidase-like regulatory domain-containing protein [Bacteroidales bacterium]
MVRKILPIVLSLRIVILILLIQSTVLSAQIRQRTYEGIVVDGRTGESLPLANVYLKGTLIGVTSDFDGVWKITIPTKADSLSFNVMGYKDLSVSVDQLKLTGNLIEMYESSFSLSEVTVSPDDAPRRLMRRVIAAKKRNDPSQYSRASFEKYTRWEYALNNISDRVKNRGPLLSTTQNFMRMSEDSSRYLPVYFSETISRNETQKAPTKQRSTIIADKTHGVDIFKQYEIGGFSSSLDVDVSFYDNTVKLLGASFVSPIADNALNYYKYYITDSTYVGADSVKVYTVKYRPKTEGNLTFIGTMDIETKYYSIKRIDAEMPKNTNINFVKKFNITSTYQLVGDSLPFYDTNNMEMHIDYMPVASSKKRLEVMCKMFNSQRDVELNNLSPLALSHRSLAYETQKSKNYKNQDSTFWNMNRHQELSKEETQVMESIDSINNVKTVKAFSRMVKLAMTGYFDAGRFEIGPYTEMFNTNKIEGIHIGCGVRTSEEISENWTVMTVLGYGIQNHRPTYQGGLSYKFDSNMRRVIDANYYDRLVKIGENENILYLYENMLTTSETNIVAQIFKREEIDELMYEQKLNLKYDHEWRTGLSSKLSVNHTWQYSPKYYPFTQNGADVFCLKRFEVSLDTRYSFKEKFIDAGVQRIYMSTDYPVVHFVMAAGRTKAGDVEGDYARIHTSFKHDVFFGQTELRYAVEGGMFFGDPVPYTMLEIPRGNKTYGFYTYDFNLMNYLEFVNDKYLYMYADYSLGGRLINLIPRASRIGLREVVGFKAMLGHFDERHLRVLDVPEKVNGVNGSYLELNVGIDNILRFFRVDAVWRVTNHNISGAPKFGIRAQFNLKL